MTRDLRTLPAAVLLMLAAAVPRAGAVEIMHDPDAIRVCLCLDQAVTAMSSALNDESNAYDGQRKALATLNAQVTEARQHLDPANEDQRAAFSRLLDERDAATRHFAAQDTPHYNDVVARYNDAATAFNHTCGDKAYDWSVLVTIQDKLSCPAAAKPQSSRQGIGRVS